MSGPTYGRAQLRQFLYDVYFKDTAEVTVPCGSHADARSLQNRINKLRAAERKATVAEQVERHRKSNSKLPPIIDDTTPLDNLTIRVAAGSGDLVIQNGKSAAKSLHELAVVIGPDGETQPAFPQEAPAPAIDTEGVFDV